MKIPNSQNSYCVYPRLFTHVSTILQPKSPADVKCGNEKVRVENAFWCNWISKIGAVLT
jgi:hypothetical protein